MLKLPPYPDSAHQYRVDGELWSIWVGKRKRCRNVDSYLREHCQSGPFLQHWSAKRQFSHVNDNVIDWEATKGARRRMTGNQRRWLAEWVFETSAVKCLTDNTALHTYDSNSSALSKSSTHDPSHLGDTREPSLRSIPNMLCLQCSNG